MRTATSQLKLVNLIAQLRDHYGHHFTTTRDGIVTGEHHDFTRHPLVGQAVAALNEALAMYPAVDHLDAVLDATRSADDAILACDKAREFLGSIQRTTTP